MKLLFITYTRIGDAILSTGVLSRLIDDHPGAHITVACGPAVSSLFDATPGIARVIPLAKRRLGGHWRDLWQACVAARWDLIVDLRNSAVPYLLWASRRRVLRGAAAADEHKVLRLARLFGLDPAPAPRLWLLDSHRRRAQELMPANGPLLALGPTANWRGKEWPADRFVALARRLCERGGALAGARIAVFGAASERAAAAPVLAGLPEDRVIDLVGRADLPTVGACLERASLFVGNDSGLMHLAAAAGAPTLGLFGPSRDTVYAPWGPATAVVRTPESFEELVGRPGYDHRTTGSLMLSLDVDRVARAAEGLLARDCAAVS